MKNKFTSLFIIASCFILKANATVWTVTNSGNIFTPDSISIYAGDTVKFTITSTHDVVEVSKATYDANGASPLSGGFSTPFSGGTVLPSKLPIGTHYYVCTPHAIMGMKGKIVVNTKMSVTNVLAQANISIYPNPTNNIVNVLTSQSLKDMEYIIVDNVGKTLLSGQLQSLQTSIGIQSLATGNYFLLIGNGNIKRTIQIVKL